jgi:predicted alpha/beta-hydrolase family hydrolase
MSVVWQVETSRGTTRVHADQAAVAQRLLVLGHGAGGGVEAPDLVAIADALPALGTSVWRVEQPWRVAGRRVAPAPRTLDDAWLQVLATAPDDLPLVLGGRSAGARVACRTAGALGAAGVVALAFPLHPPGRPEKSRASELDAVEVPVLVVQGLRDAFGRPDEIPAASGRRVVAVPGDHGLRTDVGAVVDAVATFVQTLSTAANGAGNRSPGDDVGHDEP